MADSQNAHHPDKQPPDATPAAPKPPAQMDMLKPAEPAQHSHEKTQPLHIIPPASLAPPLPEDVKAPSVTQPVSEHQPEKTQPMQAMPPASVTPAPAHADSVQSSASTVVTPPPRTDAPPPASSTPASQSSAKPVPSSGAPAAAPPRPEAAKAPATPASSPSPPRAVTRPPATPQPMQSASTATSLSYAEAIRAAANAASAAQASSSTNSPSHTEPAKASAPAASHSELTKAPAAQASSSTSSPSHTEPAKASAPYKEPVKAPATPPTASASLSSHAESIKTATTSPPPAQPSANAASSSPIETAKAPATPPSASASSSSHAESTKTVTTSPPPAQPSANAASSSPIETAKAPVTAAPKDYVKTVAMMAASPPPASSPQAAATAAPSDIDQLRITTPSSPVGDGVRRLGHRIATTAFLTEILPGAAKKLGAYAALTRLNKPIGIWLLLWPVLWALWLSSGGKPDPHVFIVFVLGTILTRSAGCAINDYADRNFDGHVKRTKDRPLVTGAVDPVEALALCAGLGLIALGLTLTLNQLAQQLTVVGGVLVITYPFFKRFFPLPQAYLGIAFTWSVPMAYAAQTGAVPRAAIVMFLAGLAWTVAYDTMYAMVDREDDKKLGIRSSALLFGDADRFIIGIMQLMTVLGLWLIGHEMELGLWYGLGLAFATTFALYQQLLIRKRKPEDCFKAFLNNNYFGMSVFIGILLEYTFR